MGELLTVLYVEDNDANFTLCQRVLETTGLYRVLRADSAERGMELLTEIRPALILLDLDLPGMGGIDFARHVKSRPHSKEIPIVVITASVMQLERRRALEAGASAFLEKPFDIHELRSLVADTLAGKSSLAPQPGA